MLVWQYRVAVSHPKQDTVLNALKAEFQSVRYGNVFLTKYLPSLHSPWRKSRGSWMRACLTSWTTSCLEILGTGCSQSRWPSMVPAYPRFAPWGRNSLAWHHLKDKDESSVSTTKNDWTSISEIRLFWWTIPYLMLAISYHLPWRTPRSWHPLTVLRTSNATTARLDSFSGPVEAAYFWRSPPLHNSITAKK